MKKALALLLAALLVFGLMACSTESPVDNSGSGTPAASDGDCQHQFEIVKNCTNNLKSFSKVREAAIRQRA